MESAAAGVGCCFGGTDGCVTAIQAESTFGGYVRYLITETQHSFVITAYTLEDDRFEIYFVTRY